MFHSRTDLKRIGVKGESMALEYLSKKGLELMDSNYCIQGGQIDLIMFDSKVDEIVFVEVKMRRANYVQDNPISEAQSRALLRTVNFWLKKNKKEEAQCRIDLIIIKQEDSGYEYDWYQNAIY
jgi:putative endonuclease